MSAVPGVAMAMNMHRMLAEQNEKQAEWESWVGQPIRKKNRQRFGNGARTAVVRGMMFNTLSGRQAFTIVGDDVLVDCVSVHLSKPGIEQ